MAVSFVGSASNGSVDGGDPSLSLPGSIAEDDVVLLGGAALDGSAGVAGASTAGYTQIADTNVASVANLATVERKVMGATPDSTVVGNGTGNGALASSYTAMVFRGVDTTTPEDVTPTIDDGPGDDPDPPSIDPTTDDCGIYVFSGQADVDTYTVPSGYSNLVQDSQDAAGLDWSTAAAWKLLSGHAAEDPGVFDGSGVTGSWGTATVALRPAAGGGGAEGAALHHILQQAGLR